MPAIDVWEVGSAGAVEFAGAFLPLIGLAIGLTLGMRLIPYAMRFVRGFVVPRFVLPFMPSSRASTARVRKSGSSSGEEGVN